MLLEKIQKENDIKQLKPEELEKLAEEREPFYAAACDCAVENQGSIETVRDRILEAWNEILSHERSEH